MDKTFIYNTKMVKKVSKVCYMSKMNENKYYINKRTITSY